MSDLDPIEPSNALELNLTDRGVNLSEATITANRSRLSTFVGWLDEQGIDNLNEFTGRMVKEYQLQRREETGWATVTEKTYMDTVRVFVRRTEGIEAVENDRSERVQSPDLGEGDNVRHEEIDSATATAVLTTLEQYHYCTLPHGTLALMWHTMCRRGAVRVLDVDDYDAREKHLQFVHRPESDTPLKKQEKSERYVAISDSMAELLDDWLDRGRPAVTDEFGREPLLATKQGRAHVSTIASYAHRYTQPCVYAGECPLGRDPDTCESTNPNKFSSCPSFTKWISTIPSWGIPSRINFLK